MTVLDIKDPAIPFGSFVVVSGVTGFIGSHVADQILAAGYKVRGTTRNAQKGAWAEEYFKDKYGLNSFELAEVPDMVADNAFDKVVIGAAGFVHVANDMSGGNQPNVTIPKAINGALNALKASAKEPAMKRFIYTSSSFAATQPKPGKEFTITTASFNDEAIERARQPDANGETVYAASKTEAERAVFKWVKENNPSFTLNTVCPNANIGSVISTANQGYPTTSGWVKAIWDMDYQSLNGIAPQHFVDVQDDAKLHVIALADPAVQNERVFAVTGPFNFNDVIRVLRKMKPQREWKDFPDDGKDLSTFEPGHRADKLLRQAYGKGFVDFEASVRANAAELVG